MASQKTTTTTTVCVQGAGISEDQNPQWRRTEDTHLVADPFNGDPQQGFYAVYDGHGGDSASKFVEQHLHLNFAKELAVNRKPVKEAFKATMATTDDQILQNEIMFTGTTAICCYLNREAPEGAGQDFRGTLYTANVGDARAVLYRSNGEVIRLSRDHRIKDPAEAQRIRDNGGFIAMNRVNGILAVTRALGDHLLKEVIVSEPDISVHTITDADKFLIIACDGLWDSMSDKEACTKAEELLEQHKEHPVGERTAAVADGLVKEALAKGTYDNVSVVFILI
ncbi:Protein phosphatase [Carpediemonas membranifera]|uniref:Protein phosphatase n=1 Tax=Carpediemonas membranifera TaxID=201153 RepID=A0A8J6DZQ3_9EUKA|nr:Protein phosphatase [Carpediemonas membranifera]|eukprot:KAG9391058.1 Protein phosphatase [Carpediemonas membranifera]